MTINIRDYFITENRVHRDFNSVKIIIRQKNNFSTLNQENYQ